MSFWALALHKRGTRRTMTRRRDGKEGRRGVGKKRGQAGMSTGVLGTIA